MVWSSKRARRFAVTRDDETFTAVDYLPFEEAREAWIEFLRLQGIEESEIAERDLMIDERDDGFVRYRLHTNALFGRPT